MNKSDILNFIQTSPKPVTKREISDAFGIRGTEQRIELKKILRELENENVIAKKPGGAYGAPEGLEEMLVIEISDIDIDGDVFAKPVTWDREGNDVPIQVSGRVVVDIDSFNRFSPYPVRYLRDWNA